MGLIRFTDAPNGVTSAGAKTAATHFHAVPLVDLAWTTWLSNPANSFPASTSFAAGVYDLSIALLQDNKHEIPFSECERVIRSYVEHAGSFACVKSYLSRASTRMKSWASEAISISSTIAAAGNQGLCFIGSRSDVNRYFGDEVWQKPWEGSGPDYLFSDWDGNATFIEVKGELSKSCSPPNPGRGIAGFVNDKVQSINAELVLPPMFPTPSVRYVLSRVRRTPDDQISVRWFNERHDPPKGEPSDVIVLATALSNFHQLLRSSGIPGFLVDRSQIPDYLTFGPESQDDALDSDPYPPGTVFVPLAVANIFTEVEEWFSRYRFQPPRQDFGDAVQKMRRLKERLKEILDRHDNDVAQGLGRDLGRRLVRLPLGLAVVADQSSNGDSK